jgi:quercetin dioxygenase-like cupin family protein
MNRVGLDEIETDEAPSRRITEVASAAVLGTDESTVRIVESYPYAETGPRHPHKHEHMEEVIHVLSGSGRAYDDGEVFDVAAGDTVLFEAGHYHMIANNTDEILKLACFFPHNDIERDFVLDEDTTFPEDEL